ncbi:hypothetical protein CBL_02831 [Carabus blaptoides fortunei]
MRSVSLVEHIEFDFTGPVLRNGLTLGDVDNDGHQELVVGNEDGDVSIFKGTECWQTLSGLGFIACVVIGDILNIKQNCLVIVSADGWCHIYSQKKHVTIDETNTSVPDSETVDGQASSSVRTEAEVEEDVILDDRGLLECVHKQRIPPNTKVAILGDVDGDGVIELVLGLTDRVVRSYRWVDSQQSDSTNENLQTNVTFKNIQGKLVGLNKWECANQIGSVTLHHAADGSPCLLVAQPGGTFMRIKCQPEGIFEQIIENFDASESNSVRSESFAASFVDYQFLGLSRMRNQNISTEILGDLNTTNDSRKQTLAASQPSTSKQSDNDTVKTKGKPYAVATLDGTIMLVQDEIILWAIQVDHQPFALEKLDVSGNGSDDIIVCSWDGQTYILDQEKNSVAFHLDEPVKAFCCGYYTVTPEVKPVPSLVYVTFWNKVVIY